MCYLALLPLHVLPCLIACTSLDLATSDPGSTKLKGSCDGSGWSDINQKGGPRNHILQVRSAGIALVTLSAGFRSVRMYRHWSGRFPYSLDPIVHIDIKTSSLVDVA